MSGWFRCRVDAWEHVADAMPKPWPRSVVLADLSWWEDRIKLGQAARIPGRRVLCRRWGWEDWPVRQILKAEAWKAPEKDHNPPTSLPLASHSPPTRLPLSTSSKRIDGDILPVASHSPPTSLPLASTARVHTETETETDLVTLEATNEARQVWEHWKAIAVNGEHPHIGARTLRKAHRSNLEQRIAETSADDCRLVIDFTHDPASGFWYEKQSWDLGTLFRPKHFDQLLERARRWQKTQNGAQRTEWALVARESSGGWRTTWNGGTARERVFRSASAALGKLTTRERGGPKEQAIRERFERQLRELGRDHA